MKNYYLLFLLTGFGFLGHAQVGIGTQLPNASSQLDVVASNKGILIPRVALTSTIDKVTIVEGNVNSLLVFNTQTIKDITPGYYYWYVDKWYRIGTAGTETITTLVDNNNGTVTYTNESGTSVIINLAAGLRGLQGIPGIDGKSITGGTGAPGATTPGKDGDTYVDNSTGDVYVKQGDTWVTTGNIKGAKGDDGKDGVDGKSITGGAGAPGGTTPGKDGDTYVDNSTGDVYVKQGDTWVTTGNIKGAKGDDGKDGADGKSITGGTGAPGATTPGKDGDTYVDNSTGDVYVKQGDTWVTTGNIKGPKGDDGKDGADGKSITGGTGAPGATTPGKDGDTYVDNSTGDVYVKQGDTWVTTGNIKGPKGDDGKDGADGKSITGGTGAPGATTPGKDGDTYVDNSTGDVYVKQGDTWVTTGNIKGAKGDDGKDGADGKSITGGTGAPGATTPGKDGDTYVDNSTGDVYVKQGDTWVTTGNIKGPKGDDGIDGKSITGGTGAPGATTPGKDGDTYVDNSTGDVYVKQGDTWVTTGNIKGPKGDDGKDGADGKSITGGTGAPGATTPGKDGDTYVDNSTGDVYVKQGDTWVTTGNIKGPKGDDGKNGADGKSITGGTGAPGATTPGKDGDTYVDNSTGDVYVKQGDTWVTTGNIKGPKGDDGKDGKSITGGTGAPGATTPGKDGDTYVDNSTGDVYVKQGDTWVTTGNIKGPKGDDGKDGKSITGGTGAPGATTPGKDGDTYVDNSTGYVYVKQGDTWVTTGNIKGPKGDDGKDGADGKSITGGIGAPGTTTPGKDGDTYVDNSTGDVYVKQGDTWVTTGNIKGPKGDDGKDGVQGPIGLTGNTGSQGAKGDTGSVGPQGTIGKDGVQGPIGLTGNTGSQGAKGDTGAAGPQGLIGKDGVQGPIGLTGNTGSQGAKGDTGAAGPQGPIGKDGLQGLTGNTGAQGAKGDTGSVGPQGPIGKDGVQGPIGLTGNTGSQGAKGDTGSVGPQGPIGKDGVQGPIGLTGTTGSQGAKGDTGAVGLQGPKGDTGASTPQTIVHSLSSVGNILTSTVNSLSPTANIINSNTLRLSGNNLFSTVNGVESTAGLDITTLEPWQVQGGVTKASTNAQNIYQTGSVAIGVSVIPSFTVGTATITPKFHVAGDISTTGKIWTANSVYADYVFEKYFIGQSVINPEYEFRSLSYVKEFIKVNHHLPGVASIDELRKAENGYTFDMTKLSIQSLEKIEELYLHTIEQKDKIDQQQAEIEDLKKASKLITDRLEMLEKLLLEK